MQDPKIPTPIDEQLRLIIAGSVIATNISSGTVSAASTGSIDSGLNFAPDLIGEPMACVVNVAAIKTSATDETYTVKMQYSDDNATWHDATVAVALTAVGNIAFGFFSKHRYHQLVITIGGTAPTITLEAFLSPLVR